MYLFFKYLIKFASGIILAWSFVWGNVLKFNCSVVPTVLLDGC